MGADRNHPRDSESEGRGSKAGREAHIHTHLHLPERTDNDKGLGGVAPTPHDLQQKAARMPQKSTRTRELCESYLSVLEAAGINPVIVTAYLRLIRSHHGLFLTASALHSDAQTLRTELATAQTQVAGLLAEIKAMHEANPGALL